jgi:hypothetical protein
MVIALLVTVGGATQVLLEVSVHFTTSLLFKEDVVKVGLLLPAFVPFTVHW